MVTEIVKRAIREAPPDTPPLVKALAANVAPSVLDDLIEEYVQRGHRTLAGPDRKHDAGGPHATREGHQELRARAVGFATSTEQAQSALTTAGSFYRDVTNAVCVDLKSVTLPVTQVLSDRVRLREQIKRVVLARLLEGVFPKETHFVLKQFLLPDRGLFRGALEDLFAGSTTPSSGSPSDPLRT